MRVSGKHNDLEEVGFSPRHHTFFEMLGNFSFGSYFKAEAIRFAYDLLTKVFQLPTDQLYYTVHEYDDDAYRIWTEADRRPGGSRVPSGRQDELLADGGYRPVRADLRNPLGLGAVTGREGVGAELQESTGRVAGTVESGVHAVQPRMPTAHGEPLPAPGVDTGMGLERIVSVLQGKRINYQTDLFTPIIARIQQLNGASDAEREADPVPYNVIADHMRAALVPDRGRRDARGRRIAATCCRMVIRRAARFGRRIGFTEPFLAEVADAVIETMGGHYKELVERRDTIRKAITQEEVRFSRTLERGLEELDTLLAALPAGGQLSGADAFFLKAIAWLAVRGNTRRGPGEGLHRR